MKRLVTTLLSLTMILSAFAGCGSKSSPSFKLQNYKLFVKNMKKVLTNRIFCGIIYV